MGRQHAAVSGALPDMPLFLSPERYVNVPLEATCQAAYRGVPEDWRYVVIVERLQPTPGPTFPR